MPGIRYYCAANRRGGRSRLSTVLRQFIRHTQHTSVIYQCHPSEVRAHSTIELGTLTFSPRLTKIRSQILIREYSALN